MEVLLGGQQLEPCTMAGAYAMEGNRGVVPWQLTENHRLRMCLAAVVNVAWGYSVVRSGVPRERQGTQLAGPGER